MQNDKLKLVKKKKKKPGEHGCLVGRYLVTKGSNSGFFASSGFCSFAVASRTSLHFNSRQRNQRFTEEIHLTQQLFRRACVFPTLACVVQYMSSWPQHHLPLWLKCIPYLCVAMGYSSASTLTGCSAGSRCSKYRGRKTRAYLFCCHERTAMNSFISTPLHLPEQTHCVWCAKKKSASFSKPCVQAFNDGTFGTNDEGNQENK